MILILAIAAMSTCVLATGGCRSFQASGTGNSGGGYSGAASISVPFGKGGDRK
ncbi:hypothetical protein OPIT5_10170 [Opitutaceae bacterium TAV5]|nr:hypothetical protein OPIT5_10170 [Opitutaceae bacterium TAV5]